MGEYDALFDEPAKPKAKDRGDYAGLFDEPAAGTKLSPSEEKAYQAWRAKLPKELQYEGDYDLRGFYKKNPRFTATSGQHMTDEFKLPNHPTFSNESRYYNAQTADLGGRWGGDVFIPNDPSKKRIVDERAEPPPVVDVGPEARRARAGGSPSRPRDLTAEQAGTSPSMQTQRQPLAKPGENTGRPGVYLTEQAPAPADAPESDYVRVRENYPSGDEGLFRRITHQNAGPAKQIVVEHGNQQEMGDPGVQMMTAGAMGRGAGALAAPLVGAIPGIGAAAAPAVAEAVESGVANKALGGDFTTGAAIPLVPKAAVAAARAPGQIAKAAGAARNAIGEGAVKRVQQRTVRNLTEDARKPVADKVARAAGEDGEQLNGVIERNPDLRHALAVQAKDKPAEALGAVDKTLGTRNGALDGAFDQMEAHYAPLPASSQASVPQILDDIDKSLAANKGDLDKTSAIRRARAAIIDEFGEDGTITPKQLRSLKQSIGRAAFPAGTAASAGVKAQVARDLYQPLKRQLETLAKNTPGLDVKKFMQANEDVATLIPVREALQQRVDKIAQNRKRFIEAARENAHKLAGLGGIIAGTAAQSPAAALAVPAALGAAKVGARVARGIDYRLAEAQLARVKAAAAASRAAQAAPRAPVIPLPIAPAAAGVATGTAQRQPSIADLYAPAM